MIKKDNYFAITLSFGGSMIYKDNYFANSCLPAAVVGLTIILSPDCLCPPQLGVGDTASFKKMNILYLKNDFLNEHSRLFKK